VRSAVNDHGMQRFPELDNFTVFVRHISGATRDASATGSIGGESYSEADAFASPFTSMGRIQSGTLFVCHDEGCGGGGTDQPAELGRTYMPIIQRRLNSFPCRAALAVYERRERGRSARPPRTRAGGAPVRSAARPRSPTPPPRCSRAGAGSRPGAAA
jgi:hypothetical protein